MPGTSIDWMALEHDFETVSAICRTVSAHPDVQVPQAHLLDLAADLVEELQGKVRASGRSVEDEVR